MTHLSLFLGGARSGKSTLAEQYVQSHEDKAWIYLATAGVHDTEMQDRVLTHQQRRSAQWQTVEEPIQIAAALRRLATADHVILVDCLTLWLSNIMLDHHDVPAAITDVLEVLTTVPGSVVCVSNEVGLGLVPEYALGRRFRDLQGVLNQRVAAVADHVVFAVSGLPLTLKSADVERRL